MAKVSAVVRFISVAGTIVIDDDEDELGPRCLKRARDEVIVIYDNPSIFAATQEESSLRHEWQSILLRSHEGVLGTLGRLIWTFLDTQTRFRVRLVDKNRSVLAFDTPIERVEVEFHTRSTLRGAEILSAANLKSFTDLKPEAQTPSQLMMCLSQSGLDLYGERFFPAKNVAYVLQSPFSNKYVRLSALRERSELLFSCRQKDGEAKETITVVVAGPIPIAFVPGIYEKEREMQQKWGFFQHYSNPGYSLEMQERIHRDLIDLTVAANNKFENNAARRGPRKWPWTFQDNFLDAPEEVPIVIDD